MSLVLQSLLPYPHSCQGTSPHQQGWDTKMLALCGIDVSKDRLDVIVLPEEQRSSVSNNRAGWADLVERLRGCSIAAIGLEASGGYERGVMRALLAGGLPVRQVNPFKLRQFARASGVLAKNDPLDARMIASFVGIMPTRPAQRPTPAAELLAEMLAVRRQLSAEKVAAENASRLLEDAMLRRLSRPPYRQARRRHRAARQASGRDRCDRCRARASIPTAHFHARGWTGPGLHVDCALARARRHDPQAGRCVGRRRSLCFRERYAQGKAVHLGRSCERPPGALHGGDERQ